MKTLYKPFTAILFFTLSLNLSFAQCWNNGDLATYNQTEWGADASITTAQNLLEANFNTVYAPDFGVLVVGGTYTMTFDNAAAIENYLPQTGPIGQLTATLNDPTDASAGGFGGDVVAMKLNIDFADAGYINGSSGLKLGDLVIYNSGIAALDGATVHQLLVELNKLLGGSSSSFGTISDLEPIVANINAAFLDGTPSTFAQQHLKKGWMSGDETTYPQPDWGNGGSGNSILISNYGTVYASTAGGFLIGGLGGYTALWTNVSILSSYLPAVGGAAALTSNITDATYSASGVFGGDVAALKLNIDYADAGFLNGNANIHFGDLVLYGFTDLTDLNGTTVRQLLPIANTLLGGGSASHTIDDIDAVLRQLNGSFFNGSPSAWAQLHLTRGWQNGDLTTYNQVVWSGKTSITTASALLEANFNTVYAATFGEMIVGGKYLMSFASPAAVEAYLPQTAAPDTLDASLADPTFSASGAFGGEVVNLKINVDFADAGLITTNSGLKFGDLTLCGFTNQGDQLNGYAIELDNSSGYLTQSQANALNGKTVRQILNELNTVLGAGTGTLGLTINQSYLLAFNLNRSFILGDPNGSPFGEFTSPFTQLHLVNGSCGCSNLIISNNQCPTAAAINDTIAVGKAVKLLLQGADADNDALTYTISQSSAHGTASIVGGDSVLYTPAAGFNGSDLLKYTVSDGTCSAEAAINIIIVVCPGQQGFWKNSPYAWPASALPMMLGTVSYNKNQLITILKTPIGSGTKADASLILADQLIPVKLSIANGSPASAALSDSITAANAIIGGNTIPMKVRPNTPLGQRMVNLATYFSNYNAGHSTTGCGARMADEESSVGAIASPEDFILEQNHPNPFTGLTTIRYSLPAAEDGNGYHVSLKVYDLVGKEIMTLADDVENEGWKEVSFDATNLPAGIYFYRLAAGSYSGVMKMIVVK